MGDLCLFVYVFKTSSSQTLKVAAFTNKVVFQKASLMGKDSCLAIYGYLDISNIASEFSERHPRDTGESWEMLFRRGGRTYMILIWTPLKPLLWLTEIFSLVKREQLELPVSQCSHGQHNSRNLLPFAFRQNQTFSNSHTSQGTEACRKLPKMERLRKEKAGVVRVRCSWHYTRALNTNFTMCASYDASISQSPYSCFKKRWGSRKSRKKAMTENGIPIWDSGNIIKQDFKIL